MALRRVQLRQIADVAAVCRQHPHVYAPLLQCTSTSALGPFTADCQLLLPGAVAHSHRGAGAHHQSTSTSPHRQWPAQLASLAARWMHWRKPTACQQSTNALSTCSKHREQPAQQQQQQQLSMQPAGSVFVLAARQQPQHMQALKHVLHSLQQSQHQHQHQQQQQQLQRCYHDLQPKQPLQQQPTADSKATTVADNCKQQQPRQQQERVAGSSLTTIPNLLSLSRVVSGPWAAYLIATQQWPLAVTLTAAAGVTDWLDGYLARRLGHTSKLGSYLDPFADKVLIGSVVGTMGYMGMLPAWLAVLVVGRDAAQISSMTWYRLTMFGGRWPGAAAFFDVDGGAGTVAAAIGVQQPSAASSSCNSSHSSSNSSSSSSKNPGPASPTAGGLPAVKPLLVSKLNTALVLLLVACCMTQQWQGLPGQDVLDVLEMAAAGTTAMSGVAYAQLYWTGKLLSSGRR